MINLLCSGHRQISSGKHRVYAGSVVPNLPSLRLISVYHAAPRFQRGPNPVTWGVSQAMGTQHSPVTGGGSQAMDIQDSR